MVLMPSEPPLLFDNIPASLQITVLGGVISSIILFAYSIISTIIHERPHKNFPLVSLDGLSSKESWVRSAPETANHGLTKYHGRPFQVISNIGPKIMLPTSYAEELKAHPGLSFGASLEREFMHQYPGFEAFRVTENAKGTKEVFVASVVRNKLTPSLGLITADLVDEATRGVDEVFGQNPEWHHVPIKQFVIQLVARLSSRVFLGKDICRNEAWLRIAKDYTVDAFLAASFLRNSHPLLRPVLSRFSPICIQLRRDVREAREIILPEVERRKAEARKAVAAGQKVPKKADTIAWMYEAAKEKKKKTKNENDAIGEEELNYVASQLTLTVAAINTTTESFMQVLLDLVSHPELIQPLRDEIADVIGNDGWTRTALYKLRLMDSFFKESQRFHPNSIVSMNRILLAPVALSTGEILPRGAYISVITSHFDPEIYPDPLTFNARRFLEEGEKTSFNPPKANSSSHVSPSAAMMGFGYGEHSCPGRFFVSNEMKILLAFILIKYDLRLPIGVAEEDGTEKRTAVELGVEVEKMRYRDEVRNGTSPKSTVEIRFRGQDAQEVELDSLLDEEEE